MIIKKLEKDEYAGKEFTVTYKTCGYYDIERNERGFNIEYKRFERPENRSFSDTLFGEWLEEPVVYGAFEGKALLGFVEGSPEKWNNRYRISNICVFDKTRRHSGIGSALINVILEEAKSSGARMVVLETQTCNENAVAFYRKNGFDIIGFDLYSYSNADVDRHEVRIEMGKKL